MSFDDCNDNCGGDDDGDDDDDLVLNRRASQPGSCSKGVLHSKSGSGSATGWISIFQICSTMLQLYISNVFHNDTIVPAPQLPQIYIFPMFPNNAGFSRM